MPYYCPKCGSPNVCRLSLYKEKHKSGFGGWGCLILILMAIFFPLTTFLLFLGGFALFILTLPIYLVVAIIGVVINLSRRSLFICEVCAHTFKPEN